MKKATFTIYTVLALLIPLLSSVWENSALAATAPSFNDPGFVNTWQRVDKPIQDLPGVGRGYTWGPTVPDSAWAVTEEYNGKERKVQYFDKARMEVNNPQGNPADLFYVTTGLLVRELVTGQRQDGDSQFYQLPPSTVQVAGDPNEFGGNAVSPTYASFKNLDSFAAGNKGQDSLPKYVISARLDKAGQVSQFTPPQPRIIGGYDEATRHNIADVFVNFGNQRGLIWDGRGFVQGSVFFDNSLYVLGRPMTEPYWIRAVVAGAEKDILVQLFERRVLTYTPTNPPAYQVEMGNVGQHYFKWRYQSGDNPLFTENRLPRLTRGLSLSHWFEGRTDEEYLKNYFKSDEADRIQGWGFRHVRLPVNPYPFFQEDNPDVLNPKYLPYLDAALDILLSRDLAVIVDLHPDDNFKQRLANDPNFVEPVSRFWKALAQHLSPRSPRRLFLELLNEPGFTSYLSPKPAIEWRQVEGKLLTAIRQGAPRHTIILDAPVFSAVDDLLKVSPVNDKNVIYNVHFYEPFVFTHQGATWTWEGVRPLKNMPYPSSPEACSAALLQIPANGQTEAQYYCNLKWDKNKLDGLLAKAADWAKRNGVALTVNEFGVYRAFAPANDRLTWISDVRSLMEKYQIGWTMWDYAGLFGLMTYDEQGNRQLDERNLRALGL